MCNYKKDIPQPKNILFPRVQFSSECGLKVMLLEGHNMDWKANDYLEPVNPNGKCMKCKTEIEVIKP